MKAKVCGMLVVGMALLATTSAEAAAKKAKKKPNNTAAIAQLKADIANAQSILQSVRDKLSGANGKESDAASRVQAAMSGIDGAKSSLRNARQTLDEIERKILGAQGEDSDYAKAEKAFEAAKQKLHDEQERVLTSSEYLAKKDAALAGPNKADDLVTVRKGALENDTDYQAALRAYKDAKSLVEGLKQDLLKQDPDWVAASKSLLEATAAEGDLEAKLQAGVMSESAAKDLIRKFAPTANAEQARIAADQAALNAMQKNTTKKKN